MQQWEEQLQEVQRKIEELDITLLPVNNGSIFHSDGCYGGSVNNVPVQHMSQSVSQNTGDSCGSRVDYPYSAAAGPRSYSVSGQDVMLDILDGYLGINAAGFGATREKTRGTQTTRKQRPGKIASLFGTNLKSDMWAGKTRSPSLTSQSVNHPSSRGTVHMSSLALHTSDSPKCPLLDRRCGSPSVLRKFGAMLQENEGKTLIEDGFVTTLVPKLVPRSPKLGGTRGSKHVTVKDTEGHVTLQNWENRGAKIGVKTSHWGNDNTQTDFKMTERILGNYPTPSPRNTPSPHQASCDSSPTTRRRSFSRPARPSNQRPPSRWASHAPTALITAPVIPRSRSLSPACKSRCFDNYGFYTETVIM
ncbi:hypothetical protein Baya_15438 [Bagarius yarrelli]|uniref:Uncharacterized protein n=1 Tax=Bagarius yarrelli TaxID=175774 RepID=A0A556VBN1_BAGYA|nr:hypothetical protein Baya_15438 [Bagarius yarrelli]